MATTVIIPTLAPPTATTDLNTSSAGSSSAPAPGITVTMAEDYTAAAIMVVASMIAVVTTAMATVTVDGTMAIADGTAVAVIAAFSMAAMGSTVAEAIAN